MMPPALQASFPLIDAYLGAMLDINLSSLTPVRPGVVESEHRLRRQASYGFVHALWCIWLSDGRLAASVPPGAGDAARTILDDLDDPEKLRCVETVADLRSAADAALRRNNMPETNRHFADVCFSCNAGSLNPRNRDGCQRLMDCSVPPAEAPSADALLS